MRFSQRYFLWLIAPPVVFGLPLSLLFLSQVLLLPAGAWLSLVGLVVTTGAVANGLFFLFIRRQAEDAEASLGTIRFSVAASNCLRSTAKYSLLAWISAAVPFAVIGALWLMPTSLGFSYFLVGFLLAALPAVAWIYVAAKRLLIAAGRSFRGLYYDGPSVPFARKIAIVFIGSFIVASLALVLLVSSRVSTTLETLAIESAADSFAGVYAVAQGAERIDPATLRSYRQYVPNEYDIYHVRPDGQWIMARGNDPNVEPLTRDEIREMLERKEGSSIHFVSPHVLRFAELPDGSILALGVPWEPFQNIPQQIALYTFVITLLTSALFVAATYFLASDVTNPMRRLMDASSAMSRGDFSSFPPIFADDEVGQLAGNFADTRINLRRLIEQVQSGGAAMSEGVHVITDGTQQLLTRSREQAELLKRSSQSLDSIREGAESILAAAEGVTGRTGDSSSRALELQASAEEVARSMDHLFQSVEKASSSITQMDASAREMSGRMSYLSEIGEQVLSFVAEMDATIGELQRSAESTSDHSRRVHEAAVAGSTAVNDTVQGIRSAQETSRRTAQVLGELQKRIAQVSQILTVIEEITERTNLLSLNAAIIAAQAGEHGAGFSVVADEIRELADRTRGSTKEISSIIKAIQAGSQQAVETMQESLGNAERNVSLAQKASQSLSRITDSATESTEMAERISSSLEEQAQSTKHLHEVTSTLSDHIAQINRGTQEQARGTKLLSEEAERIREIALQVKNSTEEQSVAGRGITSAMEQIAADVRLIRDLLQAQLDNIHNVQEAAGSMIDFAARNEELAREFDQSAHSLSESASRFESEVTRFRI